ncbi:hypothetical protein HGRIS_009019 [Hohenbuehelia grisea]|uniref:FAD dependent oxidoreductase domain-containing protein n=1 Tax=Hohenbuehelia grisea TaxID=104357 RepID=A0ABR3J198_9AGAR
MGSVLSRIRLAVRSAHKSSEAYDTLLERIAQSPGTPSNTTSQSYWSIPPSGLAQHGSSSVLPSQTDVVIIGSGITGAAIARTLLNHDSKYGVKERPLRVVMLEARDCCSGATSRNGGHITPNHYSEFASLTSRHGLEAAKQIIRFRLAHLRTLIRVAEQDGILHESQCREVETFDVFLQQELFEYSKVQLEAFRREMPAESSDFVVHEGPHAISNLQLSDRTAGCISTRAGAIHPYRFITGVLTRLLKLHEESFQLFTRTPCTGIRQTASSSNFIVETPRGSIRATHVIHATEGWSSHLLEFMRGRIVPSRAFITAQRPGQGLGRAEIATEPPRVWTGQRSFVFYPTESPAVYDYLTQQPPSLVMPLFESQSYPAPSGEFMFGGGAAVGGQIDYAVMNHLGFPDDTSVDYASVTHLTGSLPLYFRNWGDENSSTADPQDERLSPQNAGRIKAVWSGVIGVSVDGNPWVGRIPKELARRQWHRPPSACVQRCDGMETLRRDDKFVRAGGPLYLAEPGEFISAGYSGEGMDNAWLCGEALASIVVGEQEASCTLSESKVLLPPSFLISKRRWKAARVETFIERILA